jgi:hypothetical protein
MRAADQERNSWWEQFLSTTSRRFSLCPNHGLLTLLSERASAEERGLSRALSFAQRSQSRPICQLLHRAVVLLKKRNWAKQSPFSAIPKTAK